MTFSFVACEEPEKPQGPPSITLSVDEIEFEREGGSKTLEMTASRDWIVNTPSDVDWISVSPKNGKWSNDPITIEITALSNDGINREAEIEFTIGFLSKTLVVKQLGTGSASDLILYHNDFDKEEATKTYGSGSSYPYLDQFDGWQNQTGTGADAVSYAFNAVSARSNSTSNSNYSDYAGSGKNNLFFGANAYFLVQDIKLNGNTKLALTFGTEKYSQTLGSVFTKSEFHIYLSTDAKKWVELTDYSFAGGETEGRWNVASALFSVPSGTEKLSICFDVDVASSYRLDDLDLSITQQEGTAVDFSGAEEKDFSQSSDTPSEDPNTVQQITCAQFIEKADPNTTYRLVGQVTSTVNTTYCSFDMNDGTATVVVWTVNNKDEWKDVVKQGGTVTVRGKYLKYGSGDNIKHEMVDAYIEKFVPSSDKYLSISASTLDVSGNATSASFKVYSNTSWTVTTDNADYKVTNPSGSGDGTVELSFPANDGEAKTIKVTVKSSDESVEPKVLTLTHKKVGSAGDGNTVVVDITEHQNWIAGSDASYGAGYGISVRDFNFGYYKHTNTNTTPAPYADHIRVFKGAVISIAAPAGKTITKVTFNCTDKDKCADMTVLTDNNSTATADTDALTITWSGKVNRFVGHAVNSQVRIKTITVDFE